MFGQNATSPFTKSRVDNAIVIPKAINAFFYSPPSNTDNKKINNNAMIHINIIMLHLAISFFKGAALIAFPYPSTAAKTPPTPKLTANKTEE